MKKLQLAVFALLVTGFVAARSADASFGAISYSIATGNTGWSSGFFNRAAAEMEAVAQCMATDCRVVVWFNGGCGALAVSSYNPSIYGIGLAFDEGIAQNYAHRQCRINNGGWCATKQFACSP